MITKVVKKNALTFPVGYAKVDKLKTQNLVSERLQRHKMREIMGEIRE